MPNKAGNIRRRKSKYFVYRHKLTTVNREQIKEMKVELYELYNIIQRQDKIIEKVEVSF